MNFDKLTQLWASLVAQAVKNLPAIQETWIQSLSWEDPLEKGMASHSSILAWKIPLTVEPGGLQSMGSQRIGHDRVTNTLTSSDFNPHLKIMKLFFVPALQVRKPELRESSGFSRFPRLRWYLTWFLLSLLYLLSRRRSYSNTHDVHYSCVRDDQTELSWAK